MANKKFVVEVEYAPHEDNDPVDIELIEEGITEVMRSMTMDGELEDFNGISVKEVVKL